LRHAAAGTLYRAGSPLESRSLIAIMPRLGGAAGAAESFQLREQGRSTMTAFNAVRFKIKPGHEEEFLEAHRKRAADWPGLEHVNLIKTGDRSYCIIAQWSDMDALAAARPHMIATLDSFRHTLEDLGGGLGPTDPVSGPVVLKLK
jgi:hypothetical protein